MYFSSGINSSEKENADQMQPPSTPYSSVPQTIEQNQKTVSKPTIGYLSLFRFAENKDLFLITVGTIAALLLGCAVQAFILVEGLMTDAFALQGEKMVEGVLQACIRFISIGIFAFVMGWLMLTCWVIAGERQSIKCRKMYYSSLLYQEISWFDLQNQSELTSRFSIDCAAFSSAIGQKPTVILNSIGILLGGLIIAFSVGWLLSLVVSIIIPIIGISFHAYSKLLESQDEVYQKFYSKAGGLSEQALQSIKTVKQLNGEEFEEMNYLQSLKVATKKTIQYAKYHGLVVGFFFFCNFATYGLGYWFGSHCVQQTQICNPSISGQTYTAGKIQIIFECLLLIGLTMGRIFPSFQKITLGRRAAARIFKVIDRKSQISADESGGHIIPQRQFKGVIKFHNVSFAYPKHPNRSVIKNLNLEFRHNSSALVGQSGCGKSTIFQLIMRFYDPEEGLITLDGIDIKKINLRWLRQQIGYVGQEPVLFSMSIKENLLLGKQGATDFQLIQALKMAEAYTFVQSLEKKWDTHVGYNGNQLSGGQKQRIAIARALLKDPKIILLDEATSALDRKNQRAIQQAIDRIAVSRKTLTIAHRVKTIMKSDMIFVIDHGSVIERGSFKQLLRFKDMKDQDQNLIKEQTNFYLTGKYPELQSQGTRKNFIQPSELRDEQLIINSQQQSQDSQSQDQQQSSPQQKENNFFRIFQRLLRFFQGVKIQFSLSLICAVINGLSFPIFSLFVSEVLALLLSYEKNSVSAATLRKQSDSSSLILLLIGVVAFFTYFLNSYYFVKVSAVVSQKIRAETYHKILRMPIPWFDLSENSAGNLSVGLQIDSTDAKNFLTFFILLLVENLSTMVAGVIIGLIYEWKLTVIAICFIPLMIFNGYVTISAEDGFLAKKEKIYENSSNFVSESVNQIRTLASLGCEKVMVQKYSSKIDRQLQYIQKKGMVLGVLFGLSQISMYLSLGLIFYSGAVFISQGRSTLNDVFIAGCSVLFSSMVVGQNIQEIPNYTSAKKSALKILRILDSEDEDQKQIREQSKLIKNYPIKGDILLRNVDFKYESRNEYIFRNFNMSIKNGDKVAFVGQSGCGKSTILQLLQRFYDPTNGQILIDGINIRDFDVHYLRSILGVVSQEPTLFNGSFRENIEYNRENVKQSELLEAVQLANAYSFVFGEEELKYEGQEGDEIESQNIASEENSYNLDEGTESSSENREPRMGLDRNVGIRGSHISGGQKQRVAIARVIVRNPQILLLDQATSALDEENEQKVQNSLDSMMRGRTTISVAHRISTIANSDEINVFERGTVVQKGTYENLRSIKGHFFNLERGAQFL